MTFLLLINVKMSSVVGILGRDIRNSLLEFSIASFKRFELIFLFFQREIMIKNLSQDNSGIPVLQMCILEPGPEVSFSCLTLLSMKCQPLIKPKC